jgi:hypothetical protein
MEPAGINGFIDAELRRGVDIGDSRSLDQDGDGGNFAG